MFGFWESRIVRVEARGVDREFSTWHARSIKVRCKANLTFRGLRLWNFERSGASEDFYIHLASLSYVFLGSCTEILDIWNTVLRQCAAKVLVLPKGYTLPNYLFLYPPGVAYLISPNLISLEVCLSWLGFCILLYVPSRFPWGVNWFWSSETEVLTGHSIPILFHQAKVELFLLFKP